MGSAPFHPATNGLAESFVQTFKHSLKSSRESTSLQERLDAFLLHYQNSPHATTKETPAMLVFRQRLCTRLDLLKPCLAAVVSQVQETQCSYRAKNSKERKFEVGDSVLVHDYRGGEGKWTPGNVSSKTGPVSYTVESTTSALVGLFAVTMATASVLFLIFLSGVSPADQSRLRTFHLIEERMNQSAARAACRTNYTDLVTVYSDEDHAALDNLINMTGFYSDGGWIGLTRNQSSDKWSNGADVTFSNLTGDCGSGSCCAAMKADGSWENLTCTEKRPFMCYKQASIHVSDESMIWESALDYCKRENRSGLLRLESHLDQRELKFELRRRRVSGPLWVGLGQGPLSELLKSSSRLALGPWTNRNERQTQPPPSLSPAGTDTVQKSFKQKTDVSKLRPSTTSALVGLFAVTMAHCFCPPPPLLLS
ncbi:hypothetical protein NFI96_008846, partial [Prochilodus magdalenae]